MTSGPYKTIVIGCGNRFAGDDAAGLHVIDALRQLPALNFEIREFQTDCCPGFLADIPPDSLVIFIDAVQSSALPGTICCMKLPSKSVKWRHLQDLTTHGIGLAHELELARRLHGSAPRMFLLGIEAADCRPGIEMTTRVKTAVDEIAGNFQRYLQLASDIT